MVRNLGKVLANEKVKGAFDSIGGGFGEMKKGANTLYSGGTDAARNKAHARNSRKMSEELNSFSGGDKEADAIMNKYMKKEDRINSMHSFANKRSTKIGVGIGVPAAGVGGVAAVSSYVGANNERKRNMR